MATIDEDLQMYKKEQFQRCSEFNMLLHVNFFGVWKIFDLDTRGELTKNFFSNRFVDNFCRRNAFSFEKKRSDIDKEIVQYELEFGKAFVTYPWHRILNMDETTWNFINVNGKVLAITGKEAANAQLPDDYHKSFIVIAEEAELEKIDDEEIRLLNKEVKRPILTPPGVGI